MSLKPQPPRPMPPDIAAWGAKHLASDSPYKLIGDIASINELQTRALAHCGSLEAQFRKILLPFLRFRQGCYRTLSKTMIWLLEALDV